MTKRHYTIIRILISIVTMAIFIALIVNGYGWLPVTVFVAGAAISINLYLKYKGNRVAPVAPRYRSQDSQLDDRQRS
jgi:hypothetical protein